MATIEQRNRKFRSNKAFPDIDDRQVIVVDDGLASGYTMRAAVAYLRKRNPGSISVAVPTGSADTVEMLRKKVDTIYCLNIRESYPFAVASAYRNWHDLEDDDVLKLLSSKK
jgi:predicted phosphoribosyltransferase